ncbi:MAG: transglutaminase domain-containing protein [Clostridia bacterium]|nr:transglutaminase domain-containing protein [Clostridia bacterium]
MLVLLLGVLMVWAPDTASASIDALWPEQGSNVLTDKDLVVDASHSDQGYVMVAFGSTTKKKLKVRVSLGKQQLDYNIGGDGEYVVLPLQLGEGKYDIALYENVSGKKYAAGGKVTVSVSLSSANIPFLYPNQYVDYNLSTPCVMKSDELIHSDMTEQQKYDEIAAFMAQNFSYDFAKAKKVGAGELPSVTDAFENKEGICQDLAAIMVTMLRVQGIPAKMMIGYADKYYHSWTVAVINGQEVFLDPTHEIGAINAKTYKVERFY